MFQRRIRFAIFLFVALPLHQLLAASYDPAEDTPTTTSDVSTFVATGSGYDAWSGSVRRTVVDMDIPAALGTHGLKVIRTYSSSGQYGGHWSWSYGWAIEGRPFSVAGAPLVSFPDGRQLRFHAPNSTQTGETALRAKRGSNERLFLHGSQTGGGTADLWLEDGSVVHFDWIVQESSNGAYLEDAFIPEYFLDQYRQKTTLTLEDYDQYSWPFHKRLKQVTEPGGRTLTYTYDQTLVFPVQVTASTGESVTYTWQSSAAPMGIQLRQVDYSDGTSATYTYKLTAVQTDSCEGCSPDPGFSTSYTPMLATAQDSRAEGPMQAVMYDYHQNSKYSTTAGAHNFTGVVTAERHYPDGALVSGYDRINNHTETRGDGPARRFTFQELNDKLNLVTQKSDFKGQNEYFAYDANNYLNKWTNFRGYNTTYTNEPILGRPKQILHPDNSHIDYTYSDASNP
jgi:hypothetical protein